MSQVRVRFAPSPTGFLHIGGARTALFNWLYARNKNGVFVLRIEDTDQERSTQESEGVILRAMRWLGMDWDEGPQIGGEYGPYRQSERLDFYRKYANELLEEGKAYRCFCTQEELDQQRRLAKEKGESQGYDGKCRNLTEDQIREYEKQGRKSVLRLRVKEDEDIVINDLCRGVINFSSNEFGDFVLVKSDGFPSYNFAVVVDDMLMKITHVIRGDDHITNTPRQVMLYEALEADVPEFAHIPMILGNDGSRLSKRHGATSVEEYREQGYMKDATVNYLSLLGWSPKNDQEIMELEDTIKRFSLENVSKSPAVFDNAKLNWMNAQYIRNCDMEALIKEVRPFIDKDKYQIESDEWLASVLKIAREHMTLLSDINGQLTYFFDNTLDKKLNEDILKIFEKDTAFTVVDEYIERLKELSADQFVYEPLRDNLKVIMNEHGIKGKDLFMPLRVALTYSTSGPGVYPMLQVLGKEHSIRRMQEFVEKVRQSRTMEV